MKTIKVLYHAPCTDGFAAALAAWLSLGDSAEYIPCAYGDPAPDVSGCDVYILDFSFPEDVLHTMSKVAKSLTLLDHHVSAKRNLGQFKPVCCGKVHVDLTKSGAVLAWEHFHPNRLVPHFFKLIQTRDLWKWDSPGMADARDFLTWLDTRGFDFEDWAQILKLDLCSPAYDLCVEQGHAMGIKHESMWRDVAAKPSTVTVAGVAGLMVNTASVFTNEAGSYLAAKSGTFGMSWRLDERGRVRCSLRSIAPFDVERLASQFGGGGHPQAAAFTLPASALLDLAAGVLSVPAS